MAEHLNYYQHEKEETTAASAPLPVPVFVEIYSEAILPHSIISLLLLFVPML